MKKKMDWNFKELANFFQFFPRVYGKITINVSMTSNHIFLSVVKAFVYKQTYIVDFFFVYLFVNAEMLKFDNLFLVNNQIHSYNT